MTEKRVSMTHMTENFMQMDSRRLIEHANFHPDKGVKKDQN